MTIATKFPAPTEAQDWEHVYRHYSGADPHAALTLSNAKRIARICSQMGFSYDETKVYLKGVCHGALVFNGLFTYPRSF